MACVTLYIHPNHIYAPVWLVSLLLLVGATREQRPVLQTVWHSKLRVAQMSKVRGLVQSGSQWLSQERNLPTAEEALGAGIFVCCCPKQQVTYAHGLFDLF